MVNLIITRLTTWNFLQPLWRVLFKASLRGMGLLNAAGEDVTGEQWLIDRLSRKKLGVVIDVGANTRVFGGGQLRASAIHAFEPHPKIFKKYLSNTPKKISRVLKYYSTIYQLFRLSANGLLPIPDYSPVTHELFAFQNILGVLKPTPRHWLK